jgi:GDP-L-fucose synthase
MTLGGMNDLKGKKEYVAGRRGMVGSAVVRRLASERCTVLTATRAERDLGHQAVVRSSSTQQKSNAVFFAAAEAGGILANDSFPADLLYRQPDDRGERHQGGASIGCRKAHAPRLGLHLPQVRTQPIAEDTLLTGPLELTNGWYAVAKILRINWCQACRRQHGREFISALQTNLYGRGDNYDLSSSHVLPAPIRKNHVAEETGAASVEIWGTGTSRRELLHLDDPADACVVLMKAYPGDEHVNAGSGEDIAIIDLARLICEVVGFGLGGQNRERCQQTRRYASQADVGRQARRDGLAVPHWPAQGHCQGVSHLLELGARGSLKVRRS